MLRRCLSRLLLTALAATAGTTAVATEPGPLARSGASAAGVDSVGVRADLRRQALALLPLVRSEPARAFLQAVPSLPHIEPRTVFHDSTRTRYWTAAEAAALPEPQRGRLVPRSLDEDFYYLTRYGSPLAYARGLDLAAAQGLTALAGRRIADFGYGGIGHLRLLASLGADVVGIEVDSLLRALYAEPGDQGPIGASGGRITLLTGHFPAEAAIVAAVGGNYDLFLSKNTLKRGYIHPEQPADPRRLVHLGVDDTTFVRNLYRMLAPGGLVVIYNLSPPPNPPGKPYIPWADGRCPFAAGLWESAGFQVLAYDRDDAEAARRMGHALEWDRGDGAMDLEHGLFAHYSIFRKPKPSGGRD
jgi:SAM-dependent methyltransferase